MGQIVAVPLEPGDALLFHGETVHFTPPNTTNHMRRAIQVHYGSSLCRPTACPEGDGRSVKAPNHFSPGLPQHWPDEKPVQPPQKRHKSESGADGTTAGFDCDPQRPCVEPQYWNYRRAEVIATGMDFGAPYI